MAIVNELDQIAWNEWVESRPPEVQALCRKLPPDRLYKMTSSGHKVTIYSYAENGTVTVNVTGEYNHVVFDRHVFGIDPGDLEECDLPSKDERVGTRLTEPEDVSEYIECCRGTEC